MNRRTFLKSLPVTALAPFIPLPKKDEKNFPLHCCKPINWQIPDYYDKIGMQRGLAREVLSYQVLPTEYWKRFEFAKENKVFWVKTNISPNGTCCFLKRSASFSDYFTPSLWIPTIIIEACQNPKEAKEMILKEEDRCLIDSLKCESIFFTANTKYQNKKELITILNKAFRVIEAQNYGVGNLIVNPITYKKHICQLKDSHFPYEVRYNHYILTEVDVNDLKGLKQAGLVGFMWGAEVRLSNLMPVNAIILTPYPKYTGVMPVRREFERNRYSNYIQEEGIALTNTQANVYIKFV